MATMQAFGSLKKYLIYLSYVGNEFRGMQRQLPNYQNGNLYIVNTVQQALEEALALVFKPLHNVTVITSSRTDAGVHALRTTVHVELRDIHPDYITSGLNKHFMAQNIGVRIQTTQDVPQWFSCRYNATSRTYLYRIAIRKKPRPDRIAGYLDEIPFSEHGRTYFVQKSEVDVERMREVAALLPGTRDFRSFMGKPNRLPTSQSTIRSLYSLTMTPGRPFMPDYDPNADLFNFWDIRCHGRSFLYRQIRRIVGVMLAVGKGDMSLDDVRLLLDKPAAESWNPRALCVPPWGLYLVDVTYNHLDCRNPLEVMDEKYDPEEGTRMTMALSY